MDYKIDNESCILTVLLSVRLVIIGYVVAATGGYLQMLFLIKARSRCTLFDCGWNPDANRWPLRTSFCLSQVLALQRGCIRMRLRAIMAVTNSQLVLHRPIDVSRDLTNLTVKHLGQRNPGILGLCFRWTCDWE